MIDMVARGRLVFFRYTAGAVGTVVSKDGALSCRRVGVVYKPFALRAVLVVGVKEFSRMELPRRLAAP